MGVGYSAALSKHFVGFACFLGTYELCRDFFTKPGHSKDESGHLGTQIYVQLQCLYESECRPLINLHTGFRDIR